jgi:hypothetical protein
VLGTVSLVKDSYMNKARKFIASKNPSWENEDKFTKINKCTYKQRNFKVE